MTIHLPLLAWAGVGAFLVAEHRDPANRFTVLIKSLEVFIMGGLFVIAGGLFTAITFGLFATLDVEFPEVVWNSPSPSYTSKAVSSLAEKMTRRRR